MAKTKLELTWIGKENRPKLEPRILLEDAAKSHHAAKRVTKGDQFDNRLIFGDNLLALKALEAEFTGKFKCVFIDLRSVAGKDSTIDDGIEQSDGKALGCVLVQRPLNHRGRPGGGWFGSRGRPGVGMF